MSLPLPLNLDRWIEEHRDFLRPPTGARIIWEDTDFIVAVVGGPNARPDYHDDPLEELFYQLEGDMVLEVIDDGRRRSIDICAGDIFLLPPGMPHSPQRFADTAGLVVERQRRPDELDGFMWFCEKCDTKLYEEFLHVSDIVRDLPPVFERFYGNDEARTCRRCGTVMDR